MVQTLRACGFLAWFLASSAAVGSLMGGHWIHLPKPNPSVADAARARLGASDEGLVAIHVLYADCSCSRRIFEHLLTSTRLPLWKEVVLLVGPHPEFEARARSRGLRVESTTPRQLKEVYGMETAPLLALWAEGELAYLGGYTDRKQGPVIRDLELMALVAQQTEPAELPLFGCGVSRELQAMLDPFQLKYSTEEEEEP